MSALGLPIFDKAIQDANIWVNEVMDELGWDDKQRAYNLLRSTLHVLRDRLSVNEGAQLAAQLPTLIRGIYFEGYRPSNPMTKIRRKDEFVSAVQEAIGPGAGDNLDEAVTATLNVIADHVSEGEMDDIKASLPKEMHDLWD